MFTMYTFPVIQLHHITTAGAQLYYAPAVATNNNYNYTMLLINNVGLQLLQLLHPVYLTNVPLENYS